MRFSLDFDKLAGFCRSDLFLALLGGFAIGTGLVTSGLLTGDGDLPIATPVSMVSEEG